jgi:hypothetical protein
MAEGARLTDWKAKLKLTERNQCGTSRLVETFAILSDGGQSLFRNHGV